MTKLWFESILAPARTRNWAGERLGYIPLTEDEIYHQVNPAVQQIRGFHGWPQSRWWDVCLQIALHPRHRPHAAVVGKQPLRNAEPSEVRGVREAKGHVAVTGTEIARLQASDLQLPEAILGDLG